jgi:putative two-component system response regulator
LAGNGEEALDAIQKTTYDLVLLDMILPEMSGKEVLLAIRADDRFSNMKVILVSGQAPPDELSQLMNYGADDFLSKPFSAIQFQGRLRTALRLKAVQDRSIYLNQELVLNNAQLKHELQSREMDLSSTRRALVMGLSRLVELRDSRGMRHLTRMQRYARTLAEAAAKLPEFEHLIDGEFADTLECCVPLHDVGKICLPDHILMKAGILTDEERILMQTHTTFAAETFHEVARDYPAAVSFMRMAIDVIRHHHERFDGSGYPDKLAGNSIPLSARIVSICDVYDALRSRKSHRPPLSHAATCKIIQSGSTGQFDPILLSTFRQIAAKFEQIYQDDPN